ncbi:PREDICTED: probable cytochrome P450 4ac1 [Nicrophorus vespilloides]|uniref:Probable cytochrome P450 4ac1 n=1 Tax=Nicrophorus vespilloides TaxID=110193 RepID=A0ABM1MK72_NICVS|nr:PREDICTED: probable cytochrome P450 4ac1 [Nicrophorus vespilloides]
MVSHPKYLKKIFKNSSEHIEKTNFYDFFKDILGKGISIVTGPIWHNNRKALQPAFQYAMLEDFNKIFNKTGDKLLKKFEKILGRQVDVSPYINSSTMETTYESILGLNFEENPEENLKYSNTIYQYIDTCLERIFSPIKRSDFLYQLMPEHKKQQERLQEILNFTSAIVDKKREEMKRRSGDNISENSDFGIKKKSTLLDIILERFKTDEDLPYEYINEELSTFLTAGHHTVTSVLSSILYELSKHEDVQEKLFEEISSIIEDAKCISTKDINAMEYMECVVKEGLRLYSPATYIERKLDYDVEVDGSIIPKGTSINIFIFQLHRSEQVYKNAMKFDPDRFSAANIDGRDPMAFIPFSFGIRNCIGWKFAMIQIKCLLAKIIYNYRMQPLSQHFKLQLYSDGILKSKNGFPVNLSRR